jgi:hypothetical protein
MGVNQQGQPITPQQQALRGLATQASTPYQGNAQGGAAAQGAAQLAAALMARNAMQHQKQKFGVPVYNAPGTLPGTAPPLAADGSTPILGAMPPGMLPGQGAPAPQAVPQPLPVPQQ